MKIVIPLVAFGLLLGACSDPPKQGTVIGNEYNKAHYEEYMYCGAYITVNGVMTCSVWLTGEDWVNDEWKLRLRDGDHTGWVTVPEQVYDHCPIDASYAEGSCQ